MNMGNKRYELTEEQWNRIKDLIPQSRMGRPRKDDRLMLNAMLWLARSGAGWEYLPEWKCDWFLYRERHLVENFFLKLKQFRRIATRYDKLASSFLAFIHIASIAILLK